MLQKIKQILQTDLSPIFKKEFYVFPKLTSFEVKKARKALKVNFVLPKLAKKKQIRPVFTITLFLVIFACGVYLGNQVDFKLISQSQANVLDTVKGWLWFLPQSEQKVISGETFDLKESENPVYAPQTSQEEMIILAVEKAIPAVVTIIISKDVPTYEQYIERQKPFGDSSPFEIQVPKLRQNGTQEQEIGSGSGFIVSKDGLIVTNKHVVYDNKAYYTVFMSDGSFYKAKVLGTDPVQDLALIKIETENEVNKTGQVKQKTFPILTLGDSSKIKIGQTAIAIGNALGEFSNTVSVGVISGTGRTITAEGAGISEILEDILQTDAAINKGNSGGPLLNLRGEVIGVNVAVAEEAQGIGFAVPINEAKIDIKQYQEQGKISRAFLGVRYVEADDSGVLISRGDNVNEPAITPDSAADKAGLKENDIILEVSGEKITPNNTLSKIIRQHYPGQTITLKVMRAQAILTLQAVLGDRTE